MLATGALFALLFAQPMVNTARTWWTSPEAGHGLLLAPLALWLAWRQGVREGARPDRALGLVLIAVAVASRYVAALAAEAFLARASLLLAAAGLVVYAWGLRQVLAWWLPVLLLGLSVPLPEVVIGSLALPLQLQASSLGAALLEWRGIPVHLDGNVIRLPGHDLFVTEACSGLRSLTALLSLGVLLGGLMLRTVPARIALVAIALPVAVLLNGVRVFITGFLVLFVDPSLAEGFTHITEGWLLFLVALAVLAAITWVMVRLERRSGRADTPANALVRQPLVASAEAGEAPERSRVLGHASRLTGHASPPDGRREAGDGWSWSTAYAPAAFLLAGCLLNFGARPQHRAPLDQPLSTMALALAGYPADERRMSDAEQRVAGTSDYVFRVFGPDTVAAFSVYVGYYESQATGRTIHSPRNCLPGAGWQTVESGKTTLDVRGSPTVVNRYLLANGPSQAMVYYWYQGRGRVAHSEYAVKWDLLRDAIGHGRTEEALVRIVVPIPAAPGYTTEDWRRRIAVAEEIARTAAVELIPRVSGALPAWTEGRPGSGDRRQAERG
jgi:EpsI family protein